MTTASAEPPIPPDAVADLVEELQRAGYNVGVSEYILAQELLIALAATARLPSDAAEFASLLGPLLANSPAEQADFAGHFARWLETLQARPEPAPVAPVPPEERQAELERIAREHGRWKMARVFSLGMLIVAVLAIVAYLLFGGSTASWDPPEVVHNPNPVQAPAPQQRSYVWLGVPILVPIALFVGYQVWWHRRAAQFLDRRTAAEEGPVRPLFVSGSAGALFQAAPLLRAARSLRKHEMVESSALDVADTIEATLKNGGRFEPVRAKRPQLPEYLALIDRRGPRDQRADLVDALLEGLQKEGLFINRFYFDEDPRLCFPPTIAERPLRLDDLQAQYPAHKLWIFTEGDGLFDPYTGQLVPWIEQFQAWSSRALFTFEAMLNWGSRERALSEAGFRVMPASERGLADSADSLASSPRLRGDYAAELPPLIPAVLVDNVRAWTAPDPPDPRELEQCLLEVREYLGEPRYAWLAACAVYPDLRWELTLLLGDRLEQDAAPPSRLLSLEHIAALVRLPWFRVGFLPDWLRRRLADDLSPSNHASIRRALGELLLSSLDGPLASFRLDIGQADPDTVENLWKRAVRRLRRNAPPGSPLQDRVFLTHMGSSLALRIPRQVARFLRTAGRAAVHRADPAAVLEPRPFGHAMATAAAIGLAATPLLARLIASSATGGLALLAAVGVLYWTSYAAVLLADSRDPIRFGYYKVVAQLTAMLAVPVGIFSMGARAEFVLLILLPIAALVSALGSLPYLWLARQRRRRSMWDRAIHPLARRLDYFMPDRVICRLLADQAAASRSAETPYRHRVAAQLFLLGTGPVGWLIFLRRRRRKLAVLLATTIVLLAGAVEVFDRGDGLDGYSDDVWEYLGAAMLVFLWVWPFISASMKREVFGDGSARHAPPDSWLVLVQLAAVWVAAIAAWVLIPTIVLLLPVASLIGVVGAWRNKHSRSLMTYGVSALLVSILCWALISLFNWAPAEAPTTIATILTVYAGGLSAWLRRLLKAPEVFSRPQVADGPVTLGLSQL